MIWALGISFCRSYSRNFPLLFLVCRERKWNNFSWIHLNTSRTRLFEIGKNQVCLEDFSLRVIYSVPLKSFSIFLPSLKNSVPKRCSKRLSTAHARSTRRSWRFSTRADFSPNGQQHEQRVWWFEGGRAVDWDPRKSRLDRAYLGTAWTHSEIVVRKDERV